MASILEGFFDGCSYKRLHRAMRAIGIRDLRNNLSHYVWLVQAGDSVLVTHRGTVVAELRPPGPMTIPPGPSGGLAQRVTRAACDCRGRPRSGSLGSQSPGGPRGSVRGLLDAERGE